MIDHGLSDTRTREHRDAFLPFETGPLPRPLHRFGSTFPRAIAEAYCNSYTPRRGIVLDPFARPASAADAAHAADRRAVARHVSLFGEWARRVLAHAPAESELRASFTALRERAAGDAPLELVMRQLYGSTCPTCRAPVVVEAFIWERDAPVPGKKAYRCAVCGRAARTLLIEPVEDQDLGRAHEVDTDGGLRARLVKRFGEDEAARGFGESVVALYTPRNAAALELLLEAIDATLPGGRAQAFLRLALLEPLVAGSRLNAVAGVSGPLRIEKGRARRGTAAQHREINVWLEFERSFRELVQHIAPTLPPDGGIGRRPALGRASAPLPDIEMLVPEGADLVLFEAPTADLLGGWHAVAAALFFGATEAALRTDARASLRDRVLHLVRTALLEARRSSRPGAPAVAYVPHAEAGTIAAVALAGVAAGYRLRRILYQRDALAGVGRDRSSAAAFVEFAPQGVLVAEQPHADATKIEETIRAGVRGAIVSRGEPVDTDRAAVAALEALSDAKLLPALTLARGGGVSELELFLDHFRSALADGSRSGIQKVQHHAQDAYVLAIPGGENVPLDDRVEWNVFSLLSTLSDIDTRSLLRRVYALFRGVETPDRELVLRCIASYGVQDEAGRWRLRAADQLAARQEEHAAIAADLAHLGRRLGFKIWIGRHLQRRPAFAELMTDVERRVHLPLLIRGPGDVLADLDVIWYERGRMVFLWKIEWTARLHQVLVDLGEAIPDTERVFRFLVVPEERRDLIRLKFQRAPTLAGVAQQRAWRLVKYAPLRALALQDQVDLNGLEPIIGLEPPVEQGGHQMVFNW
ncbi:MAG: hypothetical protein AUH85_02065 [Chloroflexi bacterium 13_1_40CM_4_68_4]|nr:MAG: hypothetical protein AUH85_02065 [Chloroflexi bacterium 13_1_40CM_4_68_4]